MDFHPLRWMELSRKYMVYLRKKEVKTQ